MYSHTRHEIEIGEKLLQAPHTHSLKVFLSVCKKMAKEIKPSQSLLRFFAFKWKFMLLNFSFDVLIKLLLQWNFIIIIVRMKDTRGLMGPFISFIAALYSRLNKFIVLIFVAAAKERTFFKDINHSKKYWELAFFMPLAARRKFLKKKNIQLAKCCKLQ